MYVQDILVYISETFVLHKRAKRNVKIPGISIVRSRSQLLRLSLIRKTLFFTSANGALCDFLLNVDFCLIEAHIGVDLSRPTG